MTSRTSIRFAFLFIIALLAFVIPALAQDAPELPPLPGDLVVGDLQGPRGVAVDTDGTVYVAVAGNGGDYTITAMVEGEEQTSTVGVSGSVIAVGLDGTVTTVIPAIPSYSSGAEATGIYRAIPDGDTLWLVMSGSPNGAPHGDAVIGIDRETMLITTYIHLGGFEFANNPDGNEINSNAADVARAEDGTLYIVDAGANALLSWTEADGLALVTAWPDNAVPTAIEIAGDGSLYIGFLGAGVAPGAARVEHWVDGEVAQRWDGLTAVTDILVDGDTIYAVELALFSEAGPGPGDVIMLNADGSTTPVAQGLITPFGIAKGADGSLYVTFGTIGFDPTMPIAGGVVKITPSM